MQVTGSRYKLYRPEELHQIYLDAFSEDRHKKANARETMKTLLREANIRGLDPGNIDHFSWSAQKAFKEHFLPN